MRKSLSHVWLFATPWTVHGILQARILEWAAFLFAGVSPQPRDWTQVSHIACRFFTSWATKEACFTLKIFIFYLRVCFIVFMSDSLWPCGLYLSMAYFRQACWSGLPWPPKGDLTDHTLLLILLTQETSPHLLHLLHCRWILLHRATGGVLVS